MAKSNSKEAEPKKEPESKAPDQATKTTTKTKTEKSKKPLIISSIIGAAALIIIGVIIAVVLGNHIDPSDPKASPSYSRAFFIYDSGKYTLWNADGNRLTEDEYESRSDFISGYAYVSKDKQVGIIDENGNMTVDYGKYGDISAKGGLYLAQDGNTKNYQLITGNGTVLEEGEDLTITTDNSTSPFAVVNSKEKISVYTSGGKLVTSADVTDDKEIAKLDSSHDFGIFHYDKQNVVFDARNGETLASFEDDKRFDFDSVSDDRSLIILENYNDSDKYKLIKDGNVYDLDETKNYAITANNEVIGYDSYSELALLNSDYKVEKRVSSYLDLKDTNNYAVENGDGKVEIWQNGENVKTIDNADIAASGVLFENYYAIKEDDKANFYNLDGSVAFNHDYKDIRSLFDENHHAIVSDEEYKYYLIDAAGNKVGNLEARYISSRDGGYELKNEEGNYAVADEAGTWVTDFKYESLYRRNNAVDYNLWTGRKDDNKYDIIDVDNHKTVLEDVNIQSFYANYFTVKNEDNKIEYYTLEGKLFYTSEK
ncbi:hypothetical protein IKF92_03100 [Candidatus Saccharibacteria bacterium]|nr:hypothetical protein [Candidatus Saccharibacteria bacterium]